ncbi:uncharacterized protein LOC106459716 [Limulus polyphemus]|uniref:Uncharacterized protein LOC106459716 n=1 Tax=Limulus polyphemus TaxID=6850 RepID=A0ABM1SE95_LIMPO|nr:uncharacterized protein LOC106459716 [Limulus polyphemus]
MVMITFALFKLLAGLFQLSFAISQLTVYVEDKKNEVVFGGSGYSCTNLQDGAYVDYQRGCRAFFICESGKKNEFWCANGTLFNPASGCDSSSYVRCVVPKQDVSHFLVEDCSQQEDGVYTSYSADCRSFYFCRDGRKVEFNCPPGRRFDWKKGSCRLSEKVSCKRLDCHEKIDGVYADFTEACRRYFLCERGEMKEFSCPEGKAFNENLHICVDAQEMECGRARELNCHELPEGYYPVYDKNCQAFQVCENGISRKYFCPSPMVFSPETLSCAYPEQSICELPFSSLCKQKANGIYPRFDRGCREFMICKDGYLIQLGFCTHDKLFDPVTEKCQLPSQVVCNSFKDLECDGRLDGAYPLKGSRCSAFYVCINQKKVIQSTCPTSTLFDSTSELCLPSKVAECAVPSIVPATPRFQWDISHYGCDGRLGLYSDFLSGCRRFYICAYGQRYISKCPGQRIFSQITGQCEDAEVDCYAPKLLGTFLCNNGSDGIYVDVKSDCKRWHECWGEKGATYSCPAGETFNSISRACDSSGKATCGHAVAQSYQSHGNLHRVINAIPVAEAGFDCNGKRNGIFALGERDCKLFHICSNDRTFSFICPSNMAYNPVLKSCDDPATFICKKPANRNKHQTDFSCIFRVDGYYPDTDMNCKRYFVCKHGKRTTIYCPDGYLFNTLTANCEYDIGENIQCKSTTITEKLEENSQNYAYSPLDIQTGDMPAKHTSMCKECSYEITHKPFDQHSQKHHSETHPLNVAAKLTKDNSSEGIFNKWYQSSGENKESTVVVNSHKSRANEGGPMNIKKWDFSQGEEKLATTESLQLTNRNQGLPIPTEVQILSHRNQDFIPDKEIKSNTRSQDSMRDAEIELTTKNQEVILSIERNLKVKNQHFAEDTDKKLNTWIQGATEDVKKNVNIRNQNIKITIERYLNTSNHQIITDAEKNLNKNQGTTKGGEIYLNTTNQTTNENAESRFKNTNQELATDTEKRQMFITDKERNSNIKNQGPKEVSESISYNRNQDSTAERPLYSSSKMFLEDEDRSLYTRSQKSTTASSNEDRLSYNEEPGENRPLNKGNQTYSRENLDEEKALYIRDERFSTNKEYPLHTRTQRFREPKEKISLEQMSTLNNDNRAKIRGSRLPKHFHSTEDINRGNNFNQDSLTKTPLIHFKNNVARMTRNNRLMLRRRNQESGNTRRQVARKRKLNQEIRSSFTNEDKRTRSRDKKNYGISGVVSDNQDYSEPTLSFGDRIPDNFRNYNVQVHKEQQLLPKVLNETHFDTTEEIHLSGISATRHYQTLEQNNRKIFIPEVTKRREYLHSTIQRKFPTEVSRLDHPYNLDEKEQESLSPTISRPHHSDILLEQRQSYFSELPSNEQTKTHNQRNSDGISQGVSRMDNLDIIEQNKQKDSLSDSFKMMDHISIHNTHSHNQDNNSNGYFLGKIQGREHLYINIHNNESTPPTIPEGHSVSTKIPSSSYQQTMADSSLESSGSKPLRTEDPISQDQESPTQFISKVLNRKHFNENSEVDKAVQSSQQGSPLNTPGSIDIQDKIDVDYLLSDLSNRKQKETIDQGTWNKFQTSVPGGYQTEIQEQREQAGFSQKFLSIEHQEIINQNNETSLLPGFQNRTQPDIPANISEKNLVIEVPEVDNKAVHILDNQEIILSDVIGRQHQPYAIQDDKKHFQYDVSRKQCPIHSSHGELSLNGSSRKQQESRSWDSKQIFLSEIPHTGQLDIIYQDDLKGVLSEDSQSKYSDHIDGENQNGFHHDFLKTSESISSESPINKHANKFHQSHESSEQSDLKLNKENFKLFDKEELSEKNNYSHENIKHTQSYDTETENIRNDEMMFINPSDSYSSISVHSDDDDSYRNTSENLQRQYESYINTRVVNKSTEKDKSSISAATIDDLTDKHRIILLIIEVSKMLDRVPISHQKKLKDQYNALLEMVRRASHIKTSHQDKQVEEYSKNNYITQTNITSNITHGFGDTQMSLQDTFKDKSKLVADINSNRQHTLNVYNTTSNPILQTKISGITSVSHLYRKTFDESSPVSIFNTSVFHTIDQSTPPSITESILVDQLTTFNSSLHNLLNKPKNVTKSTSFVLDETTLGTVATNQLDHKTSSSFASELENQRMPHTTAFYNILDHTLTNTLVPNLLDETTDNIISLNPISQAETITIGSKIGDKQTTTQDKSELNIFDPSKTPMNLTKAFGERKNANMTDGFQAYRISTEPQTFNEPNETPLLPRKQSNNKILTTNNNVAQPQITDSWMPPSFQCPSNQVGIFPDITTGCKQFHICAQDTQQTFTCPTTMLFNMDTGQCDMSENVICQDPKMTNHKTQCTGRQNGYYPDVSKDCKQYFYCQNGQIHTFNCPQDQLFDYHNKACVTTTNIICTEDPVEHHVHGVPSQFLFDCHDKPDGVYPDYARSCHVFYYCVDGHKYSDYCRTGLLFNPETEACDIAEKVICNPPINH